jgi:transcriptional regulator with PAS, ATPase and Fis domain
MNRESWLIAWIGDADLLAANCHPKPNGRASRDGVGPIATALAPPNQRYTKLYFLSNDRQPNAEQYCSWLINRTDYTPEMVELRDIKLSSPTAYAEIYREVSKDLKTAGLPRNDVALTFHLSPGTPAMTSIWIMLAKTRFPARLIQTETGRGVEEVDFFDNLTDDFLPEYMQRRSAHIARLNEATRPADPAFSEIIHNSPEVRTQIELARRFAALDVQVLILGETGTGKELFADAIRGASPRASKPFKTVNCGALSPELANSELFGHKKGAFTGAQGEHKGYFQAADGGTLFLDEVGDLPLDTQVRLLRVLQKKEITRLGDTSPIKVDVRIIAATHRNLEEDVSTGRFREDLLQRLAGGILRLPPLRDRGTDASLLAAEFMRKIHEDGKGRPEAVEKNLSQSAINFISKHTWPGNVRELYHTLVRAHVWSTGDEITEADIRASILQVRKEKSDILSRPLGDDFSLDSVLDEVSRHFIQRALAQSGGNKTAAAKRLGLNSHQTLGHRMGRLNLSGDTRHD